MDLSRSRPRALRKFWSLPPQDRWLTLRISLLLLLMQASLRLFSFGALRRLLERLSRAHPAAKPPPISEAQRLATLITRTGNALIGKDTCLPQALTGQLMLRNRGYPARLHMGVEKNAEGRLNAHAWVECYGQVVLGGDDTNLKTYVELLDLDGVP